MARTQESSLRSEHSYHALDGPECADRAYGITWKQLQSIRPAPLQNPEGALDRQHQDDEAELTELDADVEAHQGERQVLTRQARIGQRRREAEAMQQAERERDDPWMADGKARLA